MDVDPREAIEGQLLCKGWKVRPPKCETPFKGFIRDYEGNIFESLLESPNVEGERLRIDLNKGFLWL